MVLLELNCCLICIFWCYTSSWSNPSTFYFCLIFFAFISCLWIFHLLEMKIRCNFAVISERFLHCCHLIYNWYFKMNGSLNKLLISAVVYQNDSHRSFVESLNDCSESLLNCCIPTPHLDSELLHHIEYLLNIFSLFYQIIFIYN